MKLKLILGAIAAAAVVVAAVPSMRMAALVVLGRGEGCTVTRATEIREHEQRLTAEKDRILANSKLIGKDDHGLEQYQTPYGAFWAPSNSRFILPFNLAEEASGIYGGAGQFVTKGDVVLDCGANVGTFARFALNAGAKLVVAIEPAPDNIECLRRNFKDEIAAGRVLVYPKGVWNKDDTLELLVDPDNQAADSFVIHRKGAKAVARVPLTTIDQMVSELKLDRVDFIKMDIEGAEVKALQGGRNTIARFHPRMSLSVYHQPDHPVEVPKAVKAAWSDVKVDCGPCAYANGHVRPDILWFHQ